METQKLTQNGLKIHILKLKITNLKNIGGKYHNIGLKNNFLDIAS